MPVLWAIHHATHMVEGSAEGVLRLRDMEDFLEGIAMTATQSYRKLFDMTRCSVALSKEDLFALTARIQGQNSIGPMGPAAIVAPSDENFQHARQFASLAVVDRPLKIFRELKAARDWLDAEAAKAVWPVAGEWPLNAARRSEG